MPRNPSPSSPKRRTKAASEGIAPTVRVKEEPKAKPEGYVFGRPSGFKSEYVEQVKKLYEKGWTDREVADFLEISVRTLYRWQVDSEDLCHSIKMGKEKPDDRAERSLYHRAVGFEWEEEQAFKLKETEYKDGRKVKETERVEIIKLQRVAPPDTTASIFWLCNRRKDEWRQRQEHTGAGGGPIQHQVGVSWMTEEQAKARGWA